MYLSCLFLLFFIGCVMVFACLPLCFRFFFIALFFCWIKHLISPIAI